MGRTAFKLQVQSHRIVAGVEDEQGLAVLPGQPTQQSADLTGGDEVCILIRAHAPGVCGRNPGVAGEAELGHELVARTGDDGPSGRAAAGMVIASPVGADLRSASRPGTPVYRVDPSAVGVTS